MPFSKMSNTIAADSGLLARTLNVAQKPGEVIIWLRRGPGSSVQAAKPDRIVPDVLARISAGRLEIV